MFETTRFVLGILPTIIEAIRQLEVLFPKEGMGQMKLEMLISIMREVHEISTESLPVIERVVGVVVGIFNKFGIFTTSTKK